MPSELTAIPVRQRHRRGKPTAPCFVSGERIVAPAAVEKSRATVFFVHSGLPMHSMRNELAPQRNYYAPYLIDGADLAVVSARAVSVAAGDGAQTQLFHGDIYDGGDGLLGVVMHDTPWHHNTRVADAVASAAFTALRVGRRAIVLVVREGEIPERSMYKPQAVRRYLQRVGIPFRVWSLSGVTPELEAQWGKVEDISHRNAFVEAIGRLRETLSEQRIAWVPLPAYASFQLTATKDCAFEPLAVLNPK